MVHNPPKESGVPEVFKNPKDITNISSPKDDDIDSAKNEDKSVKARASKKTTPFKKTAPQSEKAVYAFHNEAIPDPYRPLEEIPDTYASDDERNNNDVQLWANYQNMRTQKFLDNGAQREGTKVELQVDWVDFEHIIPCSSGSVLGSYISRKYSRKTRLGNLYFELGFDEEDRAQLLQTNSQTYKASVLLDESDYSAYGSSVEINSIYFSPSGKYFLCEFDAAGSISKSLYYVFDLKTGTQIEKYKQDSPISFLAWHPYFNGFYYKKMIDKNAGEKTKSVWAIYYHQIEMSWEEDLVVFEEYDHESPDADISVSFHHSNISGQSLALNVNIKSKYRREEHQYIIDWNNPVALIKVPEYSGKQYYKPHIIGLNFNAFYAVITGDYNKRSIMKLGFNGKSWDEAETILLDLQMDEIHNADFYNDCIVVIESENLENVLRVYSETGEKVFEFKPDTPSTLYFHAHPHNKGTIEVAATHYLNPLTIYSLDLKTMSIKERKQVEAPEWVKDIVVSVEYVTSQDGAEIPLTIIHRKDTVFDSSNPTMLYGYGGFGRCCSPSYDNFHLHWLKKGGIFALAHIRGDGGWKEGWAENGARRNKHNTFDDFIACAEHLTTTDKTCPDKLVSIGMSNGGLTVIAAMQKRPDLFGCVISQAPVLDMLNVAMNNFNRCRTLWNKDYGLPEVKEDYEIIRSYSPLQNIDESKEYPSSLIMTAGQDNVAHPAHALKFVATMQDRKGDESCYLYWKDKGFHSDLFKKDYNTDYNAYADMLSFIVKSLDLQDFYDNEGK